VIQRTDFESLSQRIFKTRKAGEHFFLSLSAEDTQFIRINGAKVRQAGVVEDASLDITLVLERPDGLRRASRTCTVTGLSWKDGEVIDETLKALRDEVIDLPIDPFAQLPVNYGSGESETRGNLLDRETAAQSLLGSEVKGLDIAGIYAAGPVVRAMANSEGQSLWFMSETFSLDYSVYTPNQRALKGTFAGKVWDSTAFEKEMQKARTQLPILEKTAKQVARGRHRTYLAPAALHDFVAMFSWACISEAAIQQGESALRLMRGTPGLTKSLSPLFTLSEDFRGGEVPRFNGLGEMAPEVLPLIEHGVLQNTLVSSRTAKEYGVASNAAAGSESLRSPSVDGGLLAEERILKALDTGLYLSNLHYLNWSDQTHGRITGMTRYACYWVEDGKIVAPIENMRWDDSLFTVLGTELEALTVNRAFIPNVDTYERRGIGGAWMPGALLKRMDFTL
jgi:predicted Zn-dependent protease